MGITERIYSAKKQIGMSRGGEVWFRGHRLSTWPLLPKILRFNRDPRYIYKIENGIYAEFRTHCRNYIDISGNINSWEYLSAMQHYGVATRLLDWTTDINVAIYFALLGHKGVRPEDEKTWPCIWMLNPFKLNAAFGGQEIIFDKADPVPFDYYEETIKSIRLQKCWPHEYPVAINTGYSNRRIEAQHGRFTLHGSRHEPMETIAPSMPNFYHLKKVLIYPHEITELRRGKVIGPVKHYQMFPDINGFAMYLNEEFKAES